MSFGFGVGDILAVSRLALGIWGRIRDSSDQFRAIRGEAAGLKLVLDNLAEQMSSGLLNSQQVTQIFTLVEGCHEVLQNLDAKVKNYESLNVHTSGLGHKTGKILKKLKWDQSEIDALRLRLISNTANLEAFSLGITSQLSHAMNKKVDILDDQIKSLQLNDQHKVRQDILDWLSASNFPAQQTAMSSGRQEGTGSWLIESEEFKTWTETNGRTLICQGIPGAGKTMLASLVIDHLRKTLPGRTLGIIYIYCDYRAQLEQTLSSLISSLLKQSLQQQSVIPPDVKKACQDHMNAGTRLNRHEMLEMLRMTMESFPRTFVIVDALDELSSQGQVRQNLLEALRNLQADHEYNLLTTSRHIKGLTLTFQEPLCLEIRARSDDIRRYVCGHMTQLPSCVRSNLGLQEAIAGSIVTAADGMFLLAQLHIDSLKDQASPRAIRKTLMDLPKGSKALDKAYKGAMQRIEDQLEGFKFLAKKVLGWLTYAERLMTITEIRHAIAVELGEQRFDEDNLADPNELVSVCAGLVVVDDQSDFIRLVHSTTQQYFEQNGESLLPRAQQAIAESCLTYLLYDDFATGWLYEKPMQSWPPETVMNKLKCYPFYNYAAAHWATHARHGVQHSVKSLLLDFARDDHKLSSATQVLLWSRSDRFMASQFDWDSSRSAKPVSAMHTLSYLGADDLISMLLEHEFEADPKDLNNSTPLWWAAYKGEERVVELLLSRKSVDANNLNLGSHHTALFEAAAGDHVDIVKLLIAREDVDVNRCDWERRTPLSQAAKEGHSMVVELLLTRRDVEADTRCWEGKTPLSYALEYSREDIASQLLKRDDVDVDKTDAKINAKPFQPGDSYLRPPTSSRYSEDPHDLH